MRKKNIFFVMDTFWRVSHEGSVASVGTCPFPCRLMSKGPLPSIPTLSSKFFSNASLTQPLRERFALQSSLSYLSLLCYAELDICVYLMSAVGIKMEIEDGASATVAEIVGALIDEADLQLPRQVGVGKLANGSNFFFK